MTEPASEFEDLFGGDEPEPPQVKFVNSPSQAPTLYADTLMFVTGVGSAMARLQFAEVIPGATDSADPGMKMRYVFNLAMPTDALINMTRYLISSIPNDMLKEADDGE